LFGSFRLFVLITLCLLRTYLLRKAIIFDACPPSPHEPAASVRAHLPLPLANYLHLEGERIDLLRVSGARPGRGAGPSRRAWGPASNVSVARPAEGIPASNIEQQRHLASTCSNAVRPGKSQPRSQAWPKGGKWEEGVPKWVQRRGILWQVVALRPVFYVLEINRVKGSILLFLLSSPLH
jgi:hypothetical protein